MEYLILRKRHSFGLDGANVPVGAGAGDIEALFQDLPLSEVRGLERDENVLAATEPMPLALIKSMCLPGAS